MNLFYRLTLTVYQSMVSFVVVVVFLYFIEAKINQVLKISDGFVEKYFENFLMEEGLFSFFLLPDLVFLFFLCIFQLKFKIFNNSLFSYSGPSFFDSQWLSRIKRDCGDNWRLKVSNLKKVHKGIMDYYNDVSMIMLLGINMGFPLGTCVFVFIHMCAPCISHTAVAVLVLHSSFALVLFVYGTWWRAAHSVNW